MDEGGHTEVAARCVNCFQPLQRHPADIAEDSIALGQDMEGGAPDALQGCVQRMQLGYLDRLRHMLSRNAFEQWRILLRNCEHRHAHASLLQGQLGAHQKPASRAVEGDDLAAVDLGLGHVIGL